MHYFNIEICEQFFRWLSEKGDSSDLSADSYGIPESVSSHVAVMDRKDNYVSVVTSINSWFGSKVGKTITMG